MTSNEEKRFSTPRPLSRRSPQNPFSTKDRASKIQESRRQQYLTKVRQASDEKQWIRRSDQILRQQYIDQRRSWEEEKASSAPEDALVWLDRNTTDQEKAMSNPDPYHVIDEIVSQETDALEALISYAEDPIAAKENTSVNASTTEDDDDGMDDLFKDIVANGEEVQAVFQEATKSTTQCSSQDMDTNSG